MEFFGSFAMFCYINGRFPYSDGHLFVPDGDIPSGIIGKKLNLKELFAKFFRTKSNAVVSSPFLVVLLLFFWGKETIAKNFLTELYKNLTVEVLSPENNSTLKFTALADLCAEIDVTLSNAIFVNHERIRLDMKKQEEEKIWLLWYDDDEKDFRDDVSVKMENDFPNDNNDGSDVLVKKESDNEVDDRETISYASPKRENDIHDRETILYASPRRESEDENYEKIYKEPKLETPAEIEKQAITKIFKKWIKTEQNWS